MRSFILLFFLLATEATFGQMTSLNENMNMTCVTGANGPTGWITFNPISTPDPQGKWQCGPTYGRSGTTGVSCSGFYGSTFHLDTSILVSPGLDLSAYETIFVNFDTKTTNINLGAKLELLVSADSTMNADTGVSDTSVVYNKTTSLMPLFGAGDESGWVTHQADLTPYKHIVPLYIGFRYVSASGSVGSRWYLDNVMTTIVANSIRDYEQTGKAAVNAQIRDGQLQISASGSTQPGTYDICLFDLNGRKLLADRMELRASASVYYHSAVNIAPGVYVLKLSKDGDFLSARVTAW